MAIYFLKGEQDLPKKHPDAVSAASQGEVSRTIVLIAGILAILLATVIETSGLLRPWESRLPQLLGLPSPVVQARTVLLSLPDGTGDGDHSMDVPLVLRGLSMLHPSLILLATEHPSSGDPAKLLQGVKDQLREKGIPLTEAIPPSPESLWRPVPLCRYFPPGFAERTESLPLVAGSAPAEGSSCVLGVSLQDSGTLPLFSTTASGEVAGSLWWEGLLHGQQNAPVWLLADHLLLFPNHAALPLVGGGLLIPHDLAVPRSVTSDDFLLRMEERERGILSPDFDSLWDHAIVVIGSPSLLAMASALASLREMTVLGALPLAAQAGIMLLLVIGVPAVLALSRRASWLLTGIVLTVGCLGCFWCLRQGMLPPILPWGVALVVFITATLIKRNHGIR